MTIDLNKLEQAAQKATPGPWDNRCLNSLNNMARPRHIWSEYGFIGEMNSESCLQDATFIALANPATVLALVRIARSAKALCNTDDGNPNTMALRIQELCKAMEGVE